MKKRLLSVLLSLTLLFTMIPMTMGTAVASAAGDDESKSVELYWVRSKEFLYEELEKTGLSVYDYTLELEAANKVKSGEPTYNADTDVITYNVTDEGSTRSASTYAAGLPGEESVPAVSSGVDGIIRTAEGAKQVTNPLTYKISDVLDNEKLAIAYADARLTNGTAPAAILAAFNADNHLLPTEAMGGIEYVWDGGYGTYDDTQESVLAEFGQVSTTVTANGTTYSYPTATDVPEVAAISTDYATPTGITFATPYTIVPTGPCDRVGYATTYAGLSTASALNKGNASLTAATSGTYYVSSTNGWYNVNTSGAYIAKVVITDAGLVTVTDLVTAASSETEATTNCTTTTVSGNTITVTLGGTDGSGNSGVTIGGSDADMLNFVLVQADAFATTYDLDNYKTAGVTAFNTVLAEAHTLLNSGTATKAEMDAKAQEVADAAAQITPKTAEDYDLSSFVLELSGADSSFDNTLSITYLGKDTGFAGYITDDEYTYFNVALTTGTMVPGSKIKLVSSDESILYISDTQRAYPRTSGTATVTAQLVLGDTVLATSNALTITCTANVNNTFTDTNAKTGTTILGRYCNNVGGGNEIGTDGSGVARSASSEAYIGNYCTWVSHVLTNQGSDYMIRGAETVRRFTAYFDMSAVDYANYANLYLGDVNGNNVFACDDSCYVFINGEPVFRASTNLGGGVNIVGDSGTAFDSSNTAALSNNNNTAATACNAKIKDASSCGITMTSGDVSFAAGWHAHLDGSSMDIKSYIKPGQVNRIDIIAGDFDDGGGMTRPYLYLSDKSDVYKTGAIKVTEYPFANGSYTSATFESANIEGTVVEQETDVYYGFKVENTSESTTLTNVEVYEMTLGIKVTKDGVYRELADGSYSDTPVIDFTTAENAATYASVIAGLTSLAAGGSVVINLPASVAASQYTIVAGEELDSSGNAYRNNSIQAVGYYEPYAGADLLSVNAMDTTYVMLAGTKSLVDDVVVIDYGLPVTINVLSNDELTNGTIAGIKATAGATVTHDVESTSAQVSADGFVKVTTTYTYGQVAISASDTSITYTPKKIVNDVESFYYAAGEGGKYGAAQVKVLPATMVYYEDNFSETTSTSGDALTQAKATGIVYSSNWSVVNTTTLSDNKLQAGSSSDLSTRVQSAENSLYGNDNVYALAETLSGGSSHAVGQQMFSTSIGDILADKTIGDAGARTKAVKNAIKNAGSAYTATDKYYATFYFTGTGFDIISRSDVNAGRIQANVYPVDSACSYTFDAAGKLTTDATLAKSLKSDNLHTDGAVAQVPVISIRDLAAGEYICQLVVNAGNDMSRFSLGNIVYVDAIRIYAPLSDTSAKIEAATTNYAASELNTAEYELRAMILKGAGQSSDTYEGNELGTNAVSYIANKYVTESYFVLNDSYSFNDYLMYGPKNEVYVKDGDGIAFTYTPAASGVNTLQIEAMLTDASKGTVTITATDIDTNKSTTVTVNSVTSMYYSFDSILAGATSGDRIKLSFAAATSGNALSVSNIKINKDASLAAVATAITAVTIDQGETIEVAEGGTTTLTASVTPSTALNKNVTWSSSDETVATVNSGTGVVTVVGEAGDTVTITATSAADNTKTDTITLTVAAIEITGVQIIRDGSVSVIDGGSVNVTNSDSALVFTATTLPAEAADNYTLTVNNSDFAVVSADGKTVTVTPANATESGSVTITATANGHTATYTVNVTVVVPATGIEIQQGGVAVGASTTVFSTDSSFSLTAVVTPNNATNKNYTFSVTGDSSNIATISGSTITINPANATADAELTVTATSSADPSVTDTYVINITKIYVPESIEIYKAGVAAANTIKLTPSTASFTLTAAVLPSNANNTAYTFTTTAPAGLVTIDNAAGTAVVTPSAITASASYTITATSVGDSTISKTITLSCSDGTKPTSAKVYIASGTFANSTTTTLIDSMGQSDMTTSAAGGTLLSSELTSGTEYGICVGAVQGGYISKAAKLVYDNSTGILTVTTMEFSWGTNKFTTVSGSSTYSVTWDDTNEYFVLSTGTSNDNPITAQASGGGSTPEPTVYTITSATVTTPVAVDLYTATTATLPTTCTLVTTDTGTPTYTITWAEQTDASNIGSISGNTVTFTGTGTYTARGTVNVTFSNNTTASTTVDIVYNVTDSTPASYTITSATVTTPVAVDLYTATTATLPTTCTLVTTDTGTPTYTITWAEQTDASNIGSISGNTVTFTGTGTYTARGTVNVTFSNNTTASTTVDVVYNVTDTTPGATPAIVSFTLDSYTAAQSLDLSSGAQTIALPTYTYELSNTTFDSVVWAVTAGGDIATVVGGTNLQITGAGTVTATATLYTSTTGLTATQTATYTITNSGSSSGYDTASVTIKLGSSYAGYVLNTFTPSSQKYGDGTWVVPGAVSSGKTETTVTLTKGSSYALIGYNDTYSVGYLNLAWYASNVCGLIITVAADGNITTEPAALTASGAYVTAATGGTASANITAGAQGANGTTTITIAY